MNSSVTPISNNIRFSSLNLKNHSIQTAKPQSWWHISLTVCNVSLKRRNPYPISIWQSLSFWVKSLISVACQGEIYNGSSQCLLIFLSWLDALEEQSLPSLGVGPFISTEPWEAILFQPHPISSQFEWRRLVSQSAASATRISVLHAHSCMTMRQEEEPLHQRLLICQLVPPDSQSTTHRLIQKIKIDGKLPEWFHFATVVLCRAKYVMIDVGFIEFDGCELCPL